MVASYGHATSETKKIGTVKMRACKISGCQGGEFEDGSFLGYSAM
jgi:hypothetical protein